jgi:hypothetical protein
VAAAKDHIPEVDAEAVVEEAAREALNRSVRGPRRRTSSTWANIWTSRSLSSSMVVARVRLSELRAFQPKVLTIHSVKGTLKGYDALMNLVLDDVHEVVRDDEGNESTRSLGLVVVRGTLLVLVSPVDGSEEIANPFVQAEDD